MKDEKLGKRARVAFGVANLGVAALVAVSVFRLLPARWWVVDVPSAIVALLLAASGVALLARRAQAEALTRLASAVTLAFGLALFAALVASSAAVAGTYGPIGRGASAIFALVCLLVLPYVVVLPAAELLWVGPRRASAKRS
jgi:hypothetical protein